MVPSVEIFPDKAALVERATTLVLQKIEAAIATHGRCSLALAGGSTPKPLYAGLAKANLPWNKLYIYWGDERFVPHTHADSNAKMAREAWLNQVPIPTDQIFVVPTESGDPAAVAQQYEQTLRQSGLPASAQDSDWPAFDVVLLGMGDDGHTASLFPHTAALAERGKWVTVGQKDDQPRITLTAPLINQAHSVMFLVAGASKQTALSQVFAQTADDQIYPSRLIQPGGELKWLLDEAAAVGLPADQKTYRVETVG